MCHASDHNYRNSSFIVDVMGQILRSIERISSFILFYFIYLFASDLMWVHNTINNPNHTHPEIPKTHTRYNKSENYIDVRQLTACTDLLGQDLRLLTNIVFAVSMIVGKSSESVQCAITGPCLRLRHSLQHSALYRFGRFA